MDYTALAQQAQDEIETLLRKVNIIFDVFWWLYITVCTLYILVYTDEYSSRCNTCGILETLDLLRKVLFDVF